MAPAKKRAPKTKRTVPRKNRSKRVGSRAAAREQRVDARLVEATIDLVRRHERVEGAAFREVGAKVLDDFFDGDPALAASHDPRKPLSYARLVARLGEDTTWDAADLRRAVTAEIVARSLPSALAARVEPTYLVRLRAIDDLALRAEVAAKIARDEVRGQDAKDLIARHAQREPGGHTGGPTRSPGPVLVTAAIERVLERAEESGDLATRELGRVPDTARTALSRRLRELSDRLRDLSRSLGEP